MLLWQADVQLAGEREAEAGAAAYVLPGGEVPGAAPAPLPPGAGQEDIADEPLLTGTTRHSCEFVEEKC